MQKEEISSKKKKRRRKKSDSKGTRNQSKRVQRATNISQGSISSKGRDSKVGHIDEDEEHWCDHVDDLSFFTDASFFTKSYKLRNEKINQDSKKSDVFLPTKCALCDHQIVNKIKKWSLYYIMSKLYIYIYIYNIWQLHIYIYIYIYS